MTISGVNDGGTAGEKVLDASLGFTVTTTFNAGNTGVVVGAFDNVDTADGNTTLVDSVVDSQTNSWVKAVEFTNGQGAAGSGATVSIWYTPDITTGLTSGVDTITFNLSSSVTAKAILGIEVVSTLGTLFVVSTRDVADDASDPAVLNRVLGTSQEYLAVRGIASESGATTALTPTGSWTAANQAVSGGTGGDATKMGARAEWIIATTDTFSSDPSLFAADHASALVIFSETEPSAAVDEGFPYVGGGYYHS